MNKKLSAILTLSIVCGLYQQTLASGFQISESSVSGLGRAFAGAGIAGDDASDIFYNPAGAFQTEGNQFQIGVSYIDSSSEFKNEGSTTRLGTTVFPTQGEGSDGGTSAFVPNIYYIRPLSDDLKFGLSITSPFGLKTEYDSNWVGRYHAIESELVTLDINPSIAYKVNDQLAIGAGISAQKADTTLSRATFTGTPLDGTTTIEGDNLAFGYNFGVVYEPTSTSTFGLGYRSKVKQDVDGDLTVNLPDGSSRVLGANAAVELPETIYLSYGQNLSDNLELLASARWTKWSRFEELRIQLEAPVPDDVTEQNWDDALTLSLGGNYKLSDKWTVRAGYAFDESPTSDEFRTARIPDTDRHWLSLGASLHQGNMHVDFGYAHLFGTGDNSINNEIDLVSSAPGATSDNLVGEYDGSADILGVQFRWEF